ncbi:uncharacterized protein LOC108112434 [Drosophila eugracilis]|uniref:uncharacterized protein LOC108112434 n=1 Tax=Drosophila eugracilis TaxID=29029 RepID=UPI0007E6C555|nr:uncharacterized protein LOC108112434 [Drosophila eugracilis]
MKKSGDFLSLLNDRDLLKTPSGSPIVNFIVKPMSIEMITADKLITNARRQRMMELFEQDRAWEAAELSRSGLSCIKAPDCYPCCTRYECSKVTF